MPDPKDVVKKSWDFMTKPLPPELVLGMGTSTVGVPVAGAAMRLPTWAKLAGITGAGIADRAGVPVTETIGNIYGRTGLPQPGGGGSSSAAGGGTTAGGAGGLSSYADRLRTAGLTGLGNTLAQGLNSLYAMESGGGGGGAGGSGTDYGPQYMNADTNRFNAETDRMRYELEAQSLEAEISEMMYQRTVDEAELALKRGDLELARAKFEDSKIWAARNADAVDEQNRLTGIGRQIDAFGTMGDLQLGAMGIQNDAFASAGGLTNDATGLQLRGLSDAGSLELSGYATQGDLLGQAGGLGVSNFSAVEDALLGRAGMQARGAENFSNLTNILGNLGVAQSQLALDIATTPRNAIAGFLMGRGQDGGMAAAFNPGNLLGINPQMIQSVIQQAMASAQQVGVMPQMQQFDVNGIIGQMTGAANNAARTGAANAAGIRGVANSAPGRVANDVGALRQVGQQAPGAIQGALSGLSNAAASVANKAPATMPNAPQSMQPYYATLNQMMAQGAPQAAIDMYRNNIAAAGG